MKKVKTILYLETTITSPFQIKWEHLEKTLPFMPFPGLLIKYKSKLLTVINCIFDAEENIVEVYTKQTDLKGSLPPTVVN